ncbi:dTDP-4-dehydrorhamnose reductase [Sphingobium sp. SYK-6]|uniref:dTDP-4-dehydrorhamnose reductase n=1 Tax=Sphingobium sp. (strain NBRC 103272 / SYK-6) TaxID=627192 RepID=UPI00022779F0|nr:dTDP-4-dehydrorhamnose reductase [Sphingobium sp. SYK-6]BAK68092.1 dTDP-4-dehydrorhamnose reductase [Sphingobium sp. SYK-6]
MKVVITGAGGQLGRALQASAPTLADIVALGHADLDIGDEDAVAALVGELAPDLIINAAAYTAVDRAESDADAAYRVNGVGPGNLAAAAAARQARFVHVSTDFVFDGTSGSPYAPDHPTAPLGVYGASKRAGEQAVLAACPHALIVRTAWVYGVTGGNFVRTMVRLMAEREEVRVVADQIGTPTFAGSLAGAIWALDAADARGIHHWTDSGAASWYDFAVAIQEEAVALGLLTRVVPVLPIATSDYPTPARRPAYSVLEKSAAVALVGAPAPHWRVNLRNMLGEIKANG